MSEKLSEIRPVLALIKPKEPGGVFRAEVWNTTGESDDKGRERIVSQDTTVNEDGKKIGREKYVYPEVLNEENQADLADYLASDRNPTPEELERYPSADKAAEDLGEQALEVLGVESPDEKEDEPEKEASEVDNEKVILDFKDRLAHIEAAVRSQVEGYKRNETGAVEILVRRNSTVAVELSDMLGSLNKAAKQELTYKTALLNMNEKLESLQKLLRDEAGEIDNISVETEKFGGNVSSKKNGELAHQKRSFIKETGISEGEALYAADNLDRYMQHTVDSVDAVLAAIKSAERTNGDRQGSVRKLKQDVEMIMPAAFSNHLGPDSDEIIRFEAAVRRLAYEFDDDPNSHLTTIRSKIDSVAI
jgi:hypothetical protein